MFDGLGIVFLLGLVLLLGPPVLAILAFVRTDTLRREMRALRARLETIEAGDRADAAPEAAPPASETAPSEAEPAPEPAEAAPVESAEPASTAPEPPATPPPAPAGGDTRRLERGLTDRWLIWIGGVALALGGAFLVKYSIDQGWITPVLRCALGGLLGVGLLVLAERARRRAAPDDAGRAGRRAAAALAAAGLSSLFASLYAAHALYGLIGPAVAFPALGAVSLTGVLLALWHGPFVAGLGLVGGYAVPLLVESDGPAPLALFGYLLALTLAAALLPRWRPWPWLGGLALAGNGVWVLVYMIAAFRPGDEGVLAVFLLAVTAVVSAARVGVPIPALPSLSIPLTDRVTRGLTEAAWSLGAALLALLTLDSEQAPATLAALMVLTAGGLGLGWRDGRLVMPRLAPVLAGLLVLAGWDLVVTPADRPGALVNPPLPDSARAFLAFALAQGVLVALGGWWVSRRTQRAMGWAGLATATPLLILAVTYWRLGGIGIDLGWAGLALALGALALLAAWRAAPDRPGALGAHAVGVLAAVALAATFVLEQAWLTVALALTLPATAWVEARLGATHVPGLRGAALVMAGVVLARLLLNPYVLDYPLGETAVANWLLYGYGLPALAFALAARWFLQRRDGLLVQVLEAGALAFSVLLVSLEVRHLMAGPDLMGAPLALAEIAVQINVWLGAAVVLRLWRRGDGRADRRVLRWGEMLLGLVGSLTLLVGPVLWANPLWTGVPVGPALVWNLVLPLYGTPAGLLGLWAWWAPPGSRVRRWAAPAASALLAVWLGLSVRQAFTGPVLDGPLTGEAELYAYSVLGLLFGLGVLVIGARLGQDVTRRAGLAILLAVTLKAFLIDMAGLTGLWRALSFLGLGGALIGIGALTRALERRRSAPAPGD
ncbi:DUF2339 domain-containing protein [uncultured Rhodospira sp.]|uniref:DUF2339 domain-containing protein n=1 Tax=uncultured Rhodospira sp. TaxID=1936189 RepID=UPI00262670C9|nr:DUF2339 domain-containing protein [uncultured Rhodospira sp.]